MYVIKYQNQYLRYGSYSAATPVERPEQATLYSRVQDAKRRLNENWLYINRERINMAELSIWKVTFTYTEEQLE
jgi:hypothetical protein